jgi:hypothetical protein
MASEWTIAFAKAVTLKPDAFGFQNRWVSFQLSDFDPKAQRFNPGTPCFKFKSLAIAFQPSACTLCSRSFDLFTRSFELRA